MLPLCLAAFASGGAVEAATPLGGLTVAVSPRGDQLVAGGDNRTIYVLDPGTLAVKKRVHLGAPIIRMAFDATGEMLAVNDNDGTIHLIETRGWTSKHTLKDKHHVAFSARHGLMASADRESRARVLVINATHDGKEVFRAQLAREMPVAALGISPDGARLAVLLGGNDDTEEPKVQYSAIPKELKVLEKKEYQLKNDGKTSLVQIYDIKSGKLISEKKTFFSMNGSQSVALFVKGGLVFNEYGNDGLQIKDGEEGRLVRFDGSFLYGSGVSHDGKYVMTGNLRQFAVLDSSAMDITADTGKLSGIVSEIDRLPGWPEYFKGFDAMAGATVIYGATSGYRVVMFGPDGKIIRAEAIY